MAILPVWLSLLSALFHAGWNFLARESNETDFLLHSGFLIIGLGLIPAIILEFIGTTFPLRVWLYIPISGTFLAIYYLGIIQGYRRGDFTVVYPVARALPVLFIAAADFALGTPPTRLGWLGILLVSLGLIISPLESLREVSINRYRSKAILWTLLAAAGITGYTFIDSRSADLMQPGALSALRYFVFQTSFSILVYWLMLKSLRLHIHIAQNIAAWRRPAIIALLITSSYILVLMAYQLTSETSYVVALRQSSIVIGVLLAVVVLRESVPKLRLIAATIITMGVVTIVLSG